MSQSVARPSMSLSPEQMKIRDTINVLTVQRNQALDAIAGLNVELAAKARELAAAAIELEATKAALATSTAEVEVNALKSAPSQEPAGNSNRQSRVG